MKKVGHQNNRNLMELSKWSRTISRSTLALETSGVLVATKHCHSCRVI